MRNLFLFVTFITIHCLRPLLAAEHPFKKKMPSFAMFLVGAQPVAVIFGFAIAFSLFWSIGSALFLLKA